MRRFLAIGYHGPVDPGLALRIADDALDWISARLADGLLDCLYSMAGGGRPLISNAANEEEMLTILRASPDAPDRDWAFIEIFDGVKVMQDYLKTVRTQMTGGDTARSG
jgi:hypothetical protein